MSPVGEPDYYHILGVSRDASPDAIKRAYHRLASQFHPDLHPDDPAAEVRVRSLNQAYTILRDPAQRTRYDRWGVLGPPAWQPPVTATPRALIAAAVSHLLNARERLQVHKPQRGQDLRYTLRLTPAEGRRGLEAQLTVPSMRWCPHCSGSGMAGGKTPYPCPQCRGAGEVSRPGWLLMGRCVCEGCQGEGVVITDPCRPCAGDGVMSVLRTLTIDVPSGVHHGSRLRLRGEGRPGRRGGAPGDLFVDIRIAAQPGPQRPDPC
jgi:molecular chaperone DnaJ